MRASRGAAPWPLALVLAALLLLAGVLAGCTGGTPHADPAPDGEDGDGVAGSGPGGAAPPDDAPGPGAGAGGDGGGLLAAFLPPEALYLTGDLRLAPDAPGDGAPQAVDATYTMPDYTQGAPLPARFTSDAVPIPVAWVVRGARVVLHLSAATLAVGDAAQPEVFAFLGTGEGVMALAPAEGPPALAQGQVAEVTLDLPLPRGGLVVPAGEALHLLPATLYTGPDVALLVGSAATPSRIELTDADAVFLPAGTPREVVAETGSLQGAECFIGESGGSRATFAFEVPEGTVGLRAQLARGGGAGQPDLDLDILDASGEVVVGGHTPGGDEAVALHAPNLATAGPGTWTAVVNACGAQAGAEFALTVAVLEPLATAGARATPPP